MLSHSQIRNFVKNADFKELFIELGWDNVPNTQPIKVQIKDETFSFQPLKQKRGFVIYLHEADEIPDRQTGVKIQNKIAQITAEHLLIFTDKQRKTQIWQWSRREPNSPVRISRETFTEGMSGERLAQKLKNLFFAIEEEESLTITDIASRNDSLFRARVTKRFYDEFKTQHKKFSEQIEGIDSKEQKDWYASLTLNRLMFVYFIQYKGFLDGNQKYLRTKLHETQTEIGDDMFYSFYETFLVQFFHKGLGEPNHSPELIKIIGKIPYLNGGLFEAHKIENENNIQIKDEAFEKIFDFFDRYDWHLDHRPLRNDNEINPDVLGYIFEKFINQKQMGAYYTKEDITEYISENTIIPFLFDRVKEKVSIAFDRYDGIWQILRDDPDRYIYDAVKKGVIDEDGEIIEVPEEIAVGIEDVSQRGKWNETADEGFGLPTEIWREYIARRERCLDVRRKMQNGGIYEINDLITYNLDIRQFAQDVVHNAEDSGIIKAFYQAIAGRIPERSNETFEQGITILDPTCGSGAFLFAALQILEPLLDKCLDRMEEFVELSDSIGKTIDHQLFRRVLEEIKKHPSRDYFTMKSIIINNLFGVDIMPDAVEICKLRLFLQLVAQVDASADKDNYGLEPLPDIDFNIRAGNTLVGFVNKQAVHEAFGGRDQQKFNFDNLADEFDFKAEQTAKVYEQFRLQQVKEGGEIKAEDKAELQTKLRELSDELDIFIAYEYGINVNNKTQFQNFLEKHEPFHWYSEFYGIISDGGFDVIIGNPPYLETNQIDYEIKGLPTIETRAVHSACMERSSQLLQSNGCMSMIVPLAIVSTQRMEVVQNILEENRDAWYSNYAWRPAKLFDTVNRALTIFVVTPQKQNKTFSNEYQKWYADNRDFLIHNSHYVEVDRQRNVFWIPKLGYEIEKSLLRKFSKVPQIVSSFASNIGESRIYYRTDGGLYWKVFTDFAPAFNVNGVAGHSTRETSFQVSDDSMIKPMIAALSSNSFWYWYSITSNIRHLNPYDVQNFPIPKSALEDEKLAKLGKEYLDDLQENSTMLVRNQKQTGRTETQSFKIQFSKSIIDKIDRVLAKHYGFTDEELDFIINYDIKYRMGLGS
ncbi:MAG: Eco57I restriction-modification methylase domain-containing protein [Acidobacteriota bacterium]|nr:Eco57I restriction-modification methylase domain-containing protein [Acidobacteriota bacterium]